MRTPPLLLAVALPLLLAPRADASSVVARLPPAERPAPRERERARARATPPRRQGRPRQSSSSNLDPSIEQLEDSLARARDAAGAVIRWARGLFRAHRPVMLAAGALLGLMHGGSVAFTVLFAQSFRASGWPLMRGGLERGRAAYEAAKEMQPRETAAYATRVAPLRRELVDLAAHLASLRRDGADEREQRAVLADMRRVRRELEAVPPSRRAAPVLVAACEPAVVRDVALGVWSGITVSLAAACSSAARTLGLGMSLGEVVSGAATALLARLEPTIRRALSALPAEAVMLGYLGPSVVGTQTLNLLGRSAGCWVAFRMQHLATTLSVSLLSARVLVDAVCVPLDAITHAAAGSDHRERHATSGATSEPLEADERSAAGPAPPAAAMGRGGQVQMPRREAAAWLLAVASLQSQRARRFHLPLYLKLSAFPLLAVEALLQRLARATARATGGAGGLTAGVAKLANLAPGRGAAAGGALHPSLK